MTAEPVRAWIRIDAPPEKVWEFFTRPEAIVRWMGEYAVLEPRPGGEFTVNVKGAPVRGRYLELDPPHRLLLSWGYAGSRELPPGASTVEVRLVRDGAGTRVHLEHRDLPDQESPGHAEGWKHYLARLAAAGTGDPGPDPGMRQVPPATPTGAPRRSLSRTNSGLLWTAPTRVKSWCPPSLTGMLPSAWTRSRSPGCRAGAEQQPYRG